MKQLRKTWIGITGILLVGLLCLMAGCQKAPTWQEHYDLGMQYLTESNYKEAILAFTAAIKIDPRQVEAYVGRADAYMGLYQSGGEDNLQLAQLDYEEALRLDDQLVEVYLRLAGLYIQQGETEKALALLQQGYEATGDERLSTGGTTSKETGAPVFEEREGYRDFASLSADEQQSIREAISAMQAGDLETMRTWLEGIVLMPTIYTAVDGYKVKAYSSSMVVLLEIRPKTGQGYSYQFTNIEEGMFETHQSFECANWQCNGAWSTEMSHQTTAENGNSYHIEAAGQAENNQGIATSESTLEWTGNDSVTSEIRMEDGMITYAAVHMGGMGDMEMPEMIGTETEMMTMEWEAW